MHTKTNNAIWEHEDMQVHALSYMKTYTYRAQMHKTQDMMYMSFVYAKLHTYTVYVCVYAYTKDIYIVGHSPPTPQESSTHLLWRSISHTGK